MLRPFRVSVKWWPVLKLTSAQCQRPHPCRSSPGITGRSGGTFPTKTHLQCHFELPRAAITVRRACRSTWFPAAAPQGGLKITNCPESPTDEVSGKVRHFIGNKERRHFPFLAIGVKSEHLKASICVDPGIVSCVPPSSAANVAARHAAARMEGFASSGSLGFPAVCALQQPLGAGGLPGGLSARRPTCWDCRGHPFNRWSGDRAALIFKKV